MEAQKSPPNADTSPSTLPTVSKRWLSAIPMFAIFLLLALAVTVARPCQEILRASTIGQIPFLTECLFAWEGVVSEHPWVFTGGMFAVAWSYFTCICKKDKWISLFCLASLGAFILVFALAVLALVSFKNFIDPPCIAAGTPIATPEGMREIQALQVGDIVTTRSPSGKIEPGRIIDWRMHRVKVHLKIRFSSGGTLSVTDEHPIATPNGWKHAGKLQSGDEVLTLQGSDSVFSIEHLRTKIQVFDLTVEPNANYFANGVLVHNKIGRR